MHTYQYARPALTVDLVVFGYQEKKLKVLLIKRGQEPFKDSWAIPGGFVEPEEECLAAAKRELEEETGLTGIDPAELGSFSTPHRDPRGWTVSVAYFVLTNADLHTPIALDDASSVNWFDINEAPALAFDHDLIWKAAIIKLRKSIHYEPIGLGVMKDRFSLLEYYDLYQAIAEKPIIYSVFTQNILKHGHLDEVIQDLYCFNKIHYEQLHTQGYFLDLYSIHV